MAPTAAPARFKLTAKYRCFAVMTAAVHRFSAAMSQPRPAAAVASIRRAGYPRVNSSGINRGWHWNGGQRRHDRGQEAAGHRLGARLRPYRPEMDRGPVPDLGSAAT